MASVNVTFIRATVVDLSVMPEGTVTDIDEATAAALEQAGYVVINSPPPLRAVKAVSATVERATGTPQRGR